MYHLFLIPIRMKFQRRVVGFDAEWKPNFVKASTLRRPNPASISSIIQGGEDNPISLVQLADESAVLLIHISAMNWQGVNSPTSPHELDADASHSASGTENDFGGRKYFEGRSRNPRSVSSNLDRHGNTPSNLMPQIGDADKILRDLGIVLAGCVDLSQLALSMDRGRWQEHGGKNISLAKLTEVYVHRILEKRKKIQRGNWERLLSTEMQECKLSINTCDFAQS